MDPLTRTVLGEATAFALLSLAVGLAVFGYIRRRNPEVRWHGRGNVYSHSYSGLDAAVAGLFLALFLAPLFQGVPELAGGAEGEGSAPASEAGAPVSGEMEGRSVALKPGQMESLIFGALMQVFLIGSLLTYLTVGRGFNPAELFGLRQMGLVRAGMVSVVLFIPVYFLVRAGASLVELTMEKSLPDAGPQPLVETFVTTQSDVLRAMIAFSAIVVAPLCEETLFRGFLYPVLKRFTERYFAAIFTGLLFGIIHYHVPSVVPLWVLGILLALAYELTGSLWVPVCLHALFNGHQTLRMFFPEAEIWWWFGSATVLAGDRL